MTINGHEIDLGAIILAILKSFAKKLGLPFPQLRNLLEIEGSGGIDMPYLGCTEVNFQVPGVKAINPFNTVENYYAILPIFTVFAVIVITLLMYYFVCT